MVEIDKTNKPESFREVYQRANPLPGVRPKVPLMRITSPEEADIVLCESTVICEYLATMETNDHRQEKRAQLFWPTNPSKRAQLRLFMELCGSSFSSYLAFSRVQDRQQVEDQYAILRQKMKQVDAFLLASTTGPRNNNPSFTLAEAHVAPFVLRCCGILPVPYDPISISKELELVGLQSWIQEILQRDSVRATAPTNELEKKKKKLIQRLARIQAK